MQYKICTILREKERESEGEGKAEGVGGEGKVKIFHPSSVNIGEINILN